MQQARENDLTRIPPRADVDVVVIGGGIQGLLALDALIERRYSCALVQDGDLGSGQTLHSHGFLNTGFGALGPELPRAFVDVVQPYLRNRGVDVIGEWAVIPPPGFPDFDRLPAARLPQGFEDSFEVQAVSVHDRNVSKRRVVDMLSQGRRHRILRGRATLIGSGRSVQSVHVQLAHGEEVVLSTKAVAVAAGCGSKALLTDLVGQTEQLEQIKHRRVHMICVRAPRGTLPATSVSALSVGLMLAAHESEEYVTWYVTPMEMGGGPSYDDIPTDASSDVVDEAMLVRGSQALLKLFPRLPDVEGLEIGCYAGYRQDIGDRPAFPMCELVQGTDNVVVALPSGLVASWLNMPRIVELVQGLVDPRGSESALPNGGACVQVGSVVEDRPGFEWMTWDRWSRAYLENATSRRSSAEAPLEMRRAS